MTKTEMIKKIQSGSVAALKMATLSSDQRSLALERFAERIWQRKDSILRANASDMKREKNTLSRVMLARLKLDVAKMTTICDGIRELARAPDPVHRVLDRLELDDSLILEKRTVPIGVIAVIFESRPDVIPQILSLILKSGNSALLKGGREARLTNLAFMKVVSSLNSEFKFMPKSWAQLFLDRSDVDLILKFDRLVNLVIPRGSNSLVQSIMRKTKIPVLAHADGVCHLFWDESADYKTVERVVIDAKTQYPAVCNAVETLLVHRSRVDELPRLMRELNDRGVTIYGDSAVCKLHKQALKQNAQRVRDWHKEYGDLFLAIRVVKSVQEAIEHINEFGSHHTDGILTNDSRSKAEFLAGVDSATLTVNASTRFADGYRFGMGAEVGISTSKIHARGPVGVEGLVTYQYLLSGEGHVVADYVAKGASEPSRRFKHRRVQPT